LTLRIVAYRKGALKVTTRIENLHAAHSHDSAAWRFFAPRAFEREKATVRSKRYVAQAHEVPRAQTKSAQFEVGAFAGFERRSRRGRRHNNGRRHNGRHLRARRGASGDKGAQNKRK